MPAIDINLTLDEIELLEKALDSHSHLRDEVGMKLDLLAASFLDPRKLEEQVEKSSKMIRQQNDRQILLHAKLVHAKDKLIVEEVSTSL